jgi:hypothetical protein
LRRLKSSKKHEKRVPGRWVGAPKARSAGLRRRATKKSGRKGLGFWGLPVSFDARRGSGALKENLGRDAGT